VLGPGSHSSYSIKGKNGASEIWGGVTGIQRAKRVGARQAEPLELFLTAAKPRTAVGGTHEKGGSQGKEIKWGRESCGELQKPEHREAGLIVVELYRTEKKTEKGWTHDVFPGIVNDKKAEPRLGHGMGVGRLPLATINNSSAD